MRKETITYPDYNGNERTEDFYFNLSKQEVYEMEMTTNGGLVEMVQQIVKAKNVPAIADIFKSFILKAYGEKSPDGKYFNKIDEKTGRPLSERFAQTEAFSILYMSLAQDDKKAADFFNDIIPKPDKQAPVPHPATN